jgi:hypothetical protein
VQDIGGQYWTAQECAIQCRTSWIMLDSVVQRYKVQDSAGQSSQMPDRAEQCRTMLDNTRQCMTKRTMWQWGPCMTLYFEVPPSVLNGFLLIHLTVSINIKRSGAGLFRGSHTYCIELVLNRRKMRPIELHDSQVETILRWVIRSGVQTTSHKIIRI